MLQNAAFLSRIQLENQSSSLNPAQSAEAIQLSGMSDENGDIRLVLDSTQHPSRTDCEYTMLNQCTMVSPTSYVKDLQLRGCWHLMPYNQCLGIGTPWVRWYYTKKMRVFWEIVRKFFLLVFTSSMIYFSSSIIFLAVFNWYREKNCNFLNTVAWLSW